MATGPQILQPDWPALAPHCLTWNQVLCPWPPTLAATLTLGPSLPVPSLPTFQGWPVQLPSSLHSRMWAFQLSLWCLGSAPHLLQPPPHPAAWFWPHWVPIHSPGSAHFPGLLSLSFHFPSSDRKICPTPLSPCCCCSGACLPHTH